MISTNPSAVSAPTPGWVIRRWASGHFSASCSIAWLNSSIVGFNPSSNSSRSRRRRLAHGPNWNDSSCCRPLPRHNLFLQCNPSFRATACSWFMNSGPCLHHTMPVPQQLPQIPVLPARHPDLRKVSFHHQLQNMLRIFPVRLLFAGSLAFDLARVANPQLDLQLCQQPLEPPCVPAGFHSYSYLFTCTCQSTIEAFRFFAMCQALFLKLSALAIHQSYLLKSRVKIYTYNDHCSAPFSEPVGWF